MEKGSKLAHLSNPNLSSYTPVPLLPACLVLLVITNMRMSAQKERALIEIVNIGEIIGLFHRSEIIYQPFQMTSINGQVSAMK